MHIERASGLVDSTRGGHIDTSPTPGGRDVADHKLDEAADSERILLTRLIDWLGTEDNDMAWMDDVIRGKLFYAPHAGLERIKFQMIDAGGEP